MRRTTGTSLLTLLLSIRLFGQDRPQGPAFEVASVKVNKTGAVTDRVPRRSGDNIRMHNTNLYMLVVYAHDVGNPLYQLSDSTGILDSDTMFDVDATAPGIGSDADLRAMFQTLLEDRFKLKVHWEIRELGGYDLVIARGGSKIKPTSPDNKVAVGGNLFPLGTSTVFIEANRVAHMIGKGSSMEQLVYSLSGRMRSPVRDRTGLTGTFDYDVIFALNPLRTDENSAPIVTTAIQQELGLKLEKSKVPVKVLVVDHAEKPSGN